MRRVLIEDDGKRLPAFVDRIGENLWVHYNGQIYTVALSESKSRRERSGADIDTPDVVAPMPGKITQVLCKNNEAVTKGQILIVMEAMKMEYNLKAAKDGVVEAVDTKVLDQVQLGQLLVKVKVKL